MDLVDELACRQAIALMDSDENQTNDDDDTYCDLMADEFLSYDTATSQLKPINKFFEKSQLFRQDVQQVDTLKEEEIRWFYCSSKNKARWKPMLGNDSLRVEKAWRQHQVDGLDANICIRGGLFQVNVKEKKCYPVYWSTTKHDGEEIREIGDPVIRGTWFFDNFAPLEEEAAEKVEKEHLARWKGYDIDQVKDLMTSEVMHSLHLEGCNIEWTSVTDVMYYKDATASRAWRSIGQKVGVSRVISSGYRLHRGYRELASPTDQVPPVTNLVLVVHGVGAKLDRRRVVKNVNDFRDLCRRIEIEKNIPGRSLFIPVEWRSKLKLEDEVVSLITPNSGQAQGIGGIRRFLHNTAFDLMYYTSPMYKSELVEGLCVQLNRLYDLFRQQNPDFQGKVSVFAHSLGNTLIYDILTNHTFEVAANDVTASSRDVTSTSQQAKPELKLKFEIDTIFSVGSPLPIFLCMRGLHRKHDNMINIFLPQPLRRVFNIFHPADPIAYRIEPLIYQHYSTIKPVQILTYMGVPSQQRRASAPTSLQQLQQTSSTGFSISDDVDKSSEVDSSTQPITIPEERTTTDGGDPVGSPSSDQGSPRQASYLRQVAGGAARLSRNLWSRARRSRCDDPAMTSSPTHVTHTDSPPPPTDEHDLDARLARLPARIDHVLREGFSESKLGYAALTSHTAYWRNLDLALFVTERLNEDRVGGNFATDGFAGGSLVDKSG